MMSCLNTSHKGSLVIQDRKMQVRVRLPGLTCPPPRLHIHKFKELWQKLHRSNRCNTWKNLLTTQRFVTWLNYIQTSGNFGYSNFGYSNFGYCFLTKQVIGFYVFPNPSFPISTCKFRGEFVCMLSGYGLAS